jgi:2-dehydropantoate 2-reductase
MRMLVVGAGAIGGYFGGRLLQAGQDVTFLVRARRAAELAANGLEIRSPNGDVAIPHPATVLAEELRSSFDLILLSCKAYDLEGAIADVSPAVGPQTMILPLLNGMRHLDVLDERFGPEHVLGGLCMISTTLEPGGRVTHFNKLDKFAFGERDGSRSARVEAVAAGFTGASFEWRLSQAIVQEMWEKWVFIAACAGITCLMRATIGDIVAAGGAPFTLALLDECSAIATSQGYAPRAEPFGQSRDALTREGSPIVASMFRDIERHAKVEVEHLIADLLRRGPQQGISAPTLRMACAHLQAYEVRRLREAAIHEASIREGAAQP